MAVYDPTPEGHRTSGSPLIASIGELPLATPRGHLFFYKAAIQLSLSMLRNA